MDDRTLMPISSVPRELGISERALNAAVKEGRIPVFVSDRDRRFRMVRVADVERLTTIRPLAPVRETP